MDGVKVKTYAPPPINESEILRYAGGGTADNNMCAMLRACVEESKDSFSYKVCYRVTDVEKLIKAFPLSQQEPLRARIAGAEKVILFCASVGLGVDRLVNGYSRISPTKALLFQALGTERVESLCDEFCKEIGTEFAPLCTGGRFSPGYGNLPLQMQTTVFALLNCEKYIGVTLNDSLLMTPTKSVTAFIPLFSTKQDETVGCNACNKKHCLARKENT